MFELRGYIDEAGKKRFARRFEGLDAIAAAKVTIASRGSSGVTCPTRRA